jgi:hypothetical protein
MCDRKSTNCISCNPEPDFTRTPTEFPTEVPVGAEFPTEVPVEAAVVPAEIMETPIEAVAEALSGYTDGANYTTTSSEINEVQPELTLSQVQITTTNMQSDFKGTRTFSVAGGSIVSIAVIAAVFLVRRRRNLAAVAETPSAGSAVLVEATLEESI